MPQIRSLLVRGRKLRLLRYGEVGSTQAIARVLAARGAAPGTIVLADSQTGGRGRYGRKWISPPDGLYASIILAKDRLLSVRAGVAVAEALVDYGIDPRLKWPNDVLVNGKKIAGILIEGAAGRMILGIGVNLSQAPIVGSTCVSCECGGAPSPESLLEGILNRLFSPRSNDELLSRYRGLCATVGRDVLIRLGKEEIVGKAIGVDRAGRLILKAGPGIRVVSSGECIHLRAHPSHG